MEICINIFYIQPIIPKYRESVLDGLGASHEVVVFAGLNGLNSIGFESGVKSTVHQVDAPLIPIFGKKLFYQSKVNFALIVNKPGAVITCANPRFISYWLTLLICRACGIACYSHGQGLFAYPSPGLVRRRMYKVMVALSTRYICYTESSKESLLAIGCQPAKLAVADNSVALSATVAPAQKTYVENGVLFVGRLREDCRLEQLVDAVAQLRSGGADTMLHVVGSGILEADYRARFAMHPWIVWHGAIHDDARIADISRMCRVGCYPGDAGLSVVHMFGLGLPPVVHQSMHEHMGPEPSYVIDGVNGFLFNKHGPTNGLATALAQVWQRSASELHAVGEAAYQCYLDLNQPPLGERFLRILSAQASA